MDIIAHHKKEYGCKPTVISSAPAKVNLMGELTEFIEGSLLGFCLNLHGYIAISKRDDNAVHFYSASLGERKKGSISTLKYKREDRWANMFKGVMASLAQMGSVFCGINVTIDSEIPSSIGLNSSSALEIAFASALVKLFNLDLNHGQIIESCRLSELNFLNKDSGFAAPLVSFYCEKDAAVYLDVKKMDYKSIPLNLGEYKLVLTNSCVSNTAADSEDIDWRSELNRCHAQLKKKGLKTVPLSWNKVDLNEYSEYLSESDRRFCYHLIEENKRVDEMVEALINGDMNRIGALFKQSHESLRDQLEMSCPEIDWLVKRGEETEGVLGSRLVGDGYGGCTISIIHDTKISLYKEHLEEYEKIFGFRPELIICESSAGVQTQMVDGSNENIIN